MATRKIQRRKLTKIPLGDMRDVIYIYRRRLKPPPFGSNDACEQPELYHKTKAGVYDISTIGAGDARFNGVNLGDGATNIFGFRYKSGITQDMHVVLNEEEYEIVKNINVERRGKFTNLRVKLLGDASKAVNQ